MCEIIFIAGAPGIGKSSIAKVLQERLKTPLFEFGWIPEFREKGNGEILPYIEESEIAFENLNLVVKNYLKYGFKNIIITDLELDKIQTLHKNFAGINYKLFTLTIKNNDILKSRVLTETRSSKYRDWQEAIKINNQILSAKILPQEIKINITNKSVKEILEIILKKLN